MRDAEETARLAAGTAGEQLPRAERPARSAAPISGPLVVGSTTPEGGALGQLEAALEHVRATVTVLVRKAGTKGRFKKIATDRLKVNKSQFKLSVKLPAGRWQIEVRFQDPRQVLPVTSKPVTRAIP